MHLHVCIQCYKVEILLMHNNMMLQSIIAPKSEGSGMPVVMCSCKLVSLFM